MYLAHNITWNKIFPELCEMANADVRSCQMKIDICQRSFVGRKVSKSQISTIVADSRGVFAPRSDNSYLCLANNLTLCSGCVLLHWSNLSIFARYPTQKVMHDEVTL